MDSRVILGLLRTAAVIVVNEQAVMVAMSFAFVDVVLVVAVHAVFLAMDDHTNLTAGLTGHSPLLYQGQAASF